MARKRRSYSCICGTHMSARFDADLTDEEADQQFAALVQKMLKCSDGEPGHGPTDAITAGRIRAKQARETRQRGQG